MTYPRPEQNAQEHARTTLGEGLWSRWIELRALSLGQLLRLRRDLSVHATLTGKTNSRQGLLDPCPCLPRAHSSGTGD